VGGADVADLVFIAVIVVTFAVLVLVSAGADKL
jgi:hypothetical protein